MLAFRRQQAKRANLKTGVSRKQRTPNFLKNEHPLSPFDSLFCPITDDFMFCVEDSFRYFTMQYALRWCRQRNHGLLLINLFGKKLSGKLYTAYLRTIPKILSVQKISPLSCLFLLILPIRVLQFYMYFTHFYCNIS